MPLCRLGLGAEYDGIANELCGGKDTYVPLAYRINDLLPGPYLRNLQELDLRHNETMQVHALAACSVLTALDLSWCELHTGCCGGLDLTRDGPYLSSLESLNLSENELSNFPPALEAATRLTQLVMNLEDAFGDNDLDCDHEDIAIAFFRFEVPRCV